jgi:hypothetical protein
MRRRLLLAAVIAVIVILAVPALALADTAPSRVLMRGNAVITSSGQVNHIHMELNASGDPGWYRIWISLSRLAPCRLTMKGKRKMMTTGRLL